MKCKYCKYLNNAASCIIRGNFEIGIGLKRLTERLVHLSNGMAHKHECGLQSKCVVKGIVILKNCTE